MEELGVSSKVIWAICSTLGSSDCVEIFSPPLVWGATCGLKFRNGQISPMSECEWRCLDGIRIKRGLPVT